jgi:outer membrane protein OmpA-like peptidoglycan-associated protein
MRINSLTLTGTAVALFLAACTPIDTNTGNPNQRTKEGALTGAGIGALAGILTGDGGKDKRDRALVGAAIGGLAGGVIGNNLDKQAAELQSQVSDSRVRIVNTGNELIVTMPEGILFATDSAAVQPGIQNDLYTVANNLNRYPNSRVQVIGHTDNTGTAAYNQDLSQRRAAAVSAVLINGGVSPNRLSAFGRGEDQPIASNLTPAGRAQNRRVEIHIIPTN